MPRRRRAEEHDEPLFADDENAWHDDGFTFEEHQPRGRGVRLVGCLLPLVLVAALGFGGWQAYQYLSNYFGNESCLLRSGESEEKLTPEQTANAATIVTVGTTLRDLPRYAANIAVTTAIQESKLRNLSYGDRDSVGLFQQRPSQGWGTAAQLQEPVYATNAFYDALVKVDGWQQMVITEIAQEVQRSGYPEAYADHEHEGRAIASALSGHSPEGFVCRLDGPTAAGRPDRFVAALDEETGHSGTADGQTISITAADSRHAWAVGSWSVGQAKARNVVRVQVGDREWVRGSGDDALQWHDADEPIEDTRVVVTLHDG